MYNRGDLEECVSHTVCRLLGCNAAAIAIFTLFQGRLKTFQRPSVNKTSFLRRATLAILDFPIPNFLIFLLLNFFCRKNEF